MLIPNIQIHPIKLRLYNFVAVCVKPSYGWDGQVSTSFWPDSVFNLYSHALNLCIDPQIKFTAMILIWEDFIIQIVTFFPRLTNVNYVLSHLHRHTHHCPQTWPLRTLLPVLLSTIQIPVTWLLSDFAPELSLFCVSLHVFKFDCVQCLSGSVSVHSATGC